MKLSALGESGMKISALGEKALWNLAYSENTAIHGDWLNKNLSSYKLSALGECAKWNKAP
jgi:hypothetical protein